ncbi:MAG: TrkH family potassium uptake protein [Pseudomonadota bacterium]
MPPRLLRQAKKQFLRLTAPQALILSYVGLSLAGAALLKLPLASHQPTSWMQALFTAVSASTITGLTVVDTASHFTLFGHWVLIFLMQCGGLGLMTFGILILQLSSGQLALRHRAALRESFNQSGPGDIAQLMRLMFTFVLLMELLGTLMLALQWVPQMGLWRGLFHSFFHATSAFNNAGFALASDSLGAYVGNPLVNFVISVLFISGGIGFVVIADMLNKKRFRDYALHTKLMLLGTVVINLVAMLVLLVLEHGNPETLGGLQGWGAKLWAAWFQAVSPRSSGFNTVDTGKLLPVTAFFIMGLMFIGAGSGSTGGGIKLTTFIVLLLATRAFIWQHKHPVVFGRMIDAVMTLKALAITMIALLCVIAGTFLLLLTEPGDFLNLAFEAVSAATTTGLSRGLTPSLSLAGQWIVMILMLIGRVGPLTLAFTLANPRGSRIQYPKGQVNIG